MVNIFTIAGLTELLVQVIISLIFGVVLMIPIMFIYFAVSNIIIKKRIPKTLLEKGGVNNGDCKTISKEERYTSSRTITDGELRTYAERGYKFGNNREQQNYFYGGGIKNSLPGEELQNIPHTVDGTAKSNFKRTWGDFN